jgi:hypothetical protein
LPSENKFPDSWHIPIEQEKRIESFPTASEAPLAPFGKPKIPKGFLSNLLDILEKKEPACLG